MKAPCILLTTCNLQRDDWQDLLRLIASVDAAVSSAEVVDIHHLILVQECAQSELAAIASQLPAWVELLAGDSPLSSSRARNVLIAHYQRSDRFDPSAFVAFPDDDAWFPKGALACLAQHFGERRDLQFVLARFGPEPSAEGCEMLQPMTYRHAFTRGACAAMFLRAGLLGRLGGFHEMLGLGSVMAGAEDTDMSLRAFRMAAGTSAYLPRFIVGHAAMSAAKKAAYYESGLAVLLLHRSTSAEDIIELSRRILTGAWHVLRGRLPSRAYLGALRRARRNAARLRANAP